MLESLIAALCITSITHSSCDEAGRAYAAQPHVKVRVRTLSNEVRYTLGPTLTNSLPTATALLRQEFSGRVSKHIYLQIDKDTGIFIFKHSF
jgi:hypothetical protein